MQRSNTYTIGFAAAICLVCGVIVAGFAVGLKEQQEECSSRPAEKSFDRRGSHAKWRAKDSSRDSGPFQEEYRTPHRRFEDGSIQ